MYISKDAYLGVEALARLIAYSADTPCPLLQIAGSIHQSQTYTQKLMERLQNAGLVNLKQGPNSGYYLDKEATRITISEIFQALDTPEEPAGHARDAGASDNDLTGKMDGDNTMWNALKSYFLLYLQRVSLDDLTIEASGLVADSTRDEMNIDNIDVVSRLHH